MTTGPMSAAAWTTSRTFGDPQCSPDGTLVAYVQASGAQVDLILRPVDGGPESVLPCVPPVRRAGPSSGGVFGWVGDGRALIYLAGDGTLVRLSLEDWTCAPLHHGPGPLSAVAVSPSGDQVAYVADLQHVFVSSTDPSVDATVRLSSGNDFAVDPTWSPDGERVAWHEWDDPHMPWDISRIAVRDPRAQEPIHLLDLPDCAVAQPRFAPDGERLAFLCDAGGFLIPWTVTQESPTPVPLVHGRDTEFDYAGPTWGSGQRTYCWTNDGATLVAARNHGGWGRIVEIEVATGAVEEWGDGVADAISAHGHDDTVVAIIADADKPSALVVLDGSEAVTLAQATAMGLAESGGFDPELVQWESDGVVIHGRLYRSKREHAPLLVMIHGGPTGQSPATLHPGFGFYLQRGYDILVPDYRGTSGWGRAFRQSLNGNWGDYDVDDVAAGMRAARTNGWARGPLVAYGGSAGGFTALLLAARHPELCVAVVALYPVTDLTDFGAETWRFEAHYTETLVGPAEGDDARYRERSPITHAASLSAPLLVLHGGQDAVVPVHQSRTFVDAVTAAGGSVEFHVYEDEGHGWKSPVVVVDAMQRVDAFLRSHLNEGEP